MANFFDKLKCGKYFKIRYGGSKDSKFNRLALMEKRPNFEILPQGMEKLVTFLIFKPASQCTFVVQSVER